MLEMPGYWHIVQKGLHIGNGATVLNLVTKTRWMNKLRPLTLDKRLEVLESALRALVLLLSSIS